MRRSDKLRKIKTANILAENLYLENKGLMKRIPQGLTNEHITHVLGIRLPLTESEFISEELHTRILNEQLLYETFLDTVKNFAKEKLNKVVDKINDWKDAAVMIYKVISNPQLLQNFSNNFWNKFQEGTLKTFYEFLKKIGATDFIPTIKKVVESITNLDGWKKFLASTAIASIIQYATDKLKNLAPDKIKAFIGNYLSETVLGTIISKLTDFKSYMGFLEPIIGGVQFFYDILKPTLDKFKQALQFATTQGKEFTGSVRDLVSANLAKK
jgi:hypothetical protein